MIIFATSIRWYPYFGLKIIKREKNCKICCAEAVIYVYSNNKFYSKAKRMLTKRVCRPQGFF